MADLYFDAQTGDDSTGDGSESTPWQTLTKATAEVAATDNVYLKGVSRFETHGFLLVNALNGVHVGPWPGQENDSYTIRADTNVVGTWVNSTGAEWEISIPAGLNIHSVVIDYDTSFTADFYGELTLSAGHILPNGGGAGSLLAQEFDYDPTDLGGGMGLLTVRLLMDADPNASVVGYCIGDLRNGVTYGGIQFINSDDCTHNGGQFFLICEDRNANFIGVVPANAQTSTYAVISAQCNNFISDGGFARDTGLHSIGHTAAQPGDNAGTYAKWDVGNCRGSGDESPTLLVVTEGSSSGGTLKLFEECVVHCSTLRKQDESLWRVFTGPQSTQSLFAHGSTGSEPLVHVDMDSCMILGYTGHKSAIGNMTFPNLVTHTGPISDPDNCHLRMRDCESLDMWAGATVNAAPLRINVKRHKHRTLDIDTPSTTDAGAFRQNNATGAMYLESCDVIVDALSISGSNAGCISTNNAGETEAVNSSFYLKGNAGITRILNGTANFDQLVTLTQCVFGQENAADLTRNAWVGALDIDQNMYDASVNEWGGGVPLATYDTNANAQIGVTLEYVNIDAGIQFPTATSPQATIDLVAPTETPNGINNAPFNDLFGCFQLVPTPPAPPSGGGARGRDTADGRRTRA